MRAIILLIILYSAHAGYTQQSSVDPVYYEVEPSGWVRFYFDKQYYLTDKNCEFKSIERVAQFDTRSSLFDGQFKDFNLSGHLALSGNYTQGKKDGEFKAYHSNQVLKWEAIFSDDTLSGNWKFYYPDGKPYLDINFLNNRVNIISFWDRKGKQRVSQGKGRYEIRIPIVTYHEWGYPMYQATGNIRNGIQHGYWAIHLIDDDGNRTLSGEETYNNGNLTEAYNLFSGAAYSTPYSIIPYEGFLKAGQLVGKPCTFDDYSGFTGFLIRKFNSFFEHIEFEGSVQHPFVYTVNISEHGDILEAEIVKPLTDNVLNPILETAISSIHHYYPSVQRGTSPSETLTIRGVLQVNDRSNPLFHSFEIEREDDKH